jgi:hypothetical protein
MIRWAAALALLICCADSAAAATACRSSAGKDGYYRYRLIQGKKCWTRGHEKIAKSELYWKSETRSAAVRLAGAAVGRLDEMTSGELARPTDSGLRPPPDFDGVFAFFENYAVAKPAIYLLHPTRVSRAYGARAVATIAYRRTQ